MLFRHAPELPERVLQAGGQGRETLAAQDHLGVLPAGVDKREVIDQVVQGLPCNRHAQLVGIEEVGHALPPRLMGLAEDHLPLCPVLGTPQPYTALQGAPCRHQIPLGVATLHSPRAR